MKISEVKQAESTLKGFCVTGKVVRIYDSKIIKGEKQGQPWSFVATGIKLEDETDWIYVNFTDVDNAFEKLEGQTITCISCSINDYVDKKGVKQRSLRANECSTDVTLQEDTAEPVEITPEEYEEQTKKDDIAHPELPKTKPVQEDIIGELSGPPIIPKTKNQEELSIEKEPEKAGVWDIKDLKIIRQHMSSDATALVCKFYKGNLPDALDEAKAVTDVLVAHLYRDLDHPIKNETEKTQAKLLDNMKAESDKNVVNAEITALQKKALDLKKELFTLTGSDVEYALVLEKFGVDNVIDLDSGKLIIFNATVANKVLDLQKGE